LRVEAADLETLGYLLKGRVLLLCHHNADPDSVCAAYAVRELAMALDDSAVVDIVLPGGASSLSRRIMAELGISVTDVTSLEGVDALVLVDTATLMQLEGLGEAVASTEVPKVFIDHHSPLPEMSSIASLYIVDEDASSTCEIVHRLYDGYGLTPSKGVAKALLTGMAFDSRRFSIGTVRTLASASRLLEIDGSLEDVIAMLSPERERSEAMARLKAAQRMRLHEVGGWIIATSHVGSFQASAARAFLGLGADVAVVAGRDKRKLRASLRATNGFYKETSVHLGRDIALPLGAEFGGAGSGHPTAAGVNGEGALRALLTRSIELISAKLNDSLGPD
jgi:nanoRNase/pAp phosphatase (c-di-AMP/oligoRNAs hydrolase)